MILKFLLRIRDILFGINTSQVRFDILQNKIDAISVCIENMSNSVINSQLALISIKDRFDIFYNQFNAASDSIENISNSTLRNELALANIKDRFDIFHNQLNTISGFIQNVKNDVEIEYKASGYIEEPVENLNMTVGELNSDNIDKIFINKYTYGEAIRIAFIVQHPSVWSSWRSLWVAASKDARFSIRVVLAPFIHPFSSEAKTYDDMKQCLTNDGVPFLTEAYFDPNSYRAHIVFIQNPYEETRPVKFRIEKFHCAGSRIAYIPYGLEMGGGAWNLKAQFNSHLHRSAWRIFARSERHKKMFAKYCHAGNSHVVVTGHPKLDKSIDNTPSKFPLELLKKIGERKIILWTPHFSVGNQAAWSTFQTFGELIMRKIRHRPDTFLLIRPHPLFFKAMRQHNVWNDLGEDDFRKMIEETDNFALDETDDYHAAFSVAHALMADVGSFLLEFLPTGKPIIYLHRSGGLGMNDDSELVNYLYRGFDKTDIIEFIEMISHGNDPIKETREKITNDFLYGINLESTAGERICEHIYSALSSGDDWTPHKLEESVAQVKSEAYWRGASNTYLALPDFYEQKQVLLDEFLNNIPKIDSAIDIGCGDGKFTLQIAAHVNKIIGYDISQTLVEMAKRAASDANIRNVQYVVQSLEEISPMEKFDLTSCMGVTSCILDDIRFLSILDSFSMLSRKGSLLLMIDTLSSGQDQVVSDQNGYVAKYRSIDDYRILITRRDFFLKKEILIKEDPERNLVNKMFVFEFSPFSLK